MRHGMKKVKSDTRSDAEWDAGWYRLARKCASPNFGPRPNPEPPDLIVLHSISLPPGQFGGPAVLALFTNQLDWTAHPYFQTIKGLQVSAHFFIRRNGEVWQLVSCDQRAWHAGQSQYSGRPNCNDYSIGVELEGLEGGLFETPQYDALTQLCLALERRYPITHIVGHEHVAPGRKSDPGPGFEWALLQAKLGWSATRFPAQAVAKHSP